MSIVSNPRTSERSFKNNSGEAYSGAEVVSLADRLNADVSLLAPAVSLPLDQWNVISSNFQDAAQLLYGIVCHDPVPDIVAENKVMRDALTVCHKALTMVVDPTAIKSSSVMHAFTHAVEAEAKARAALSIAQTSGDGQ